MRIFRIKPNLYANSKNFISMMLSFLKVGTIGFGGGAALIPVIEQEIVGKKNMNDDQLYLSQFCEEVGFDCFAY